MPFKMKEDGTIFQDEKGFPVYIGVDGSEHPYDVDSKAKQIAELTEKASKRGKEIEAMTAKYAPFSDIEDIAAFLEEHKKNAETVASLADKDRENEANVQKRISEAVKAAVNPVSAERDKLKAENEALAKNLNVAVIGNAFANSVYAAEKLVNPALAQQLFAGRFVVRDGKPIGLGDDGTELYGANGIATFDEALCKMVETSPFRENIMKPAPGGSGSNGGGHIPPNNANLSSREKIAAGLKKMRGLA